MFWQQARTSFGQSGLVITQTFSAQRNLKIVENYGQAIGHTGEESLARVTEGWQLSPCQCSFEVRPYSKRRIDCGGKIPIVIWKTIQGHIIFFRDEKFLPALS